MTSSERKAIKVLGENHSELLVLAARLLRVRSLNNPDPIRTRTLTPTLTLTLTLTLTVTLTLTLTPTLTLTLTLTLTVTLRRVGAGVHGHICHATTQLTTRQNAPARSQNAPARTRLHTRHSRAPIGAPPLPRPNPIAQHTCSIVRASVRGKLSLPSLYRCNKYVYLFTAAHSMICDPRTCPGPTHRATHARDSGSVSLCTTSGQGCAARCSVGDASPAAGPRCDERRHRGGARSLCGDRLGEPVERTVDRQRDVGDEPIAEGIDEGAVHDQRAVRGHQTSQRVHKPIQS